MEPSIQGLRGPRTRRLKSVLRIKTGPGFTRDSRHPVRLSRNERGARFARDLYRRLLASPEQTRRVEPGTVLNRFHGALGPGFPAPFRLQPTAARSENTGRRARRRIRHRNHSKHEPALSCAKCHRTFRSSRRSGLRNRPHRFIGGHHLCRRGKELQRTLAWADDKRSNLLQITSGRYGESIVPKILKNPALQARPFVHPAKQYLSRVCDRRLEHLRIEAVGAFTRNGDIGDSQLR